MYICADEENKDDRPGLRAEFPQHTKQENLAYIVSLLFFHIGRCGLHTLLTELRYSVEQIPVPTLIRFPNNYPSS